jgi:hypothetical protein
MSLPRVASNKYTRYEAYIEITESNKITYADFKQFSITASTLATASVTSFCSNVKSLNLEPLFNTGTASENTYHVDFVFHGDYATDLGSGITDGNSYPIAAAVTDSNITVATASGILSEDRTITISGFSSWDNGKTYRIFTAVEHQGTNDTATATLYFLHTNDPNVKQIVNTGALSGLV